MKRPLISLIIPVYNVNPNIFEKTICSVFEQTYSNWEICISDSSEKKKRVKEILEKFPEYKEKIKYMDHAKPLGISENSNHAISLATGEYIGFLDQDDILAPIAIEEVTKAITKKAAKIIYSDEDKVDTENKHFEPFFKPNWSLDLLYCQNYICHFFVVHKSLLKDVGLLNKKYDGAQDYDLFLRLSEKKIPFYHIPKILYSWRTVQESTSIHPEAKEYAQQAGLNALNDHLKRVYNGKAQAYETEYLYVYQTKFDLLKNQKVSIIIPMKDKYDLTETCIYSILENTKYQNYELLILDNNSQEESTKRWFQEIQKVDKRIKVIDAFFEFNWSKLQNFGISKASGEVYIFLNNDTVITHDEWLDVLCNNALREDVGAVGPLLAYSDDTIQHAGVVIGLGGYADHVFKAQKQKHKAINYVSPMVARNVLAVTGACMAISKNTIQKIGGFNEKFIICGSDVEICLRAYRKGLRNIYTPFTKLYHLESKSRDSYIPEIDFKMSEKYYKEFWKNGDPYYNPNLSLGDCTPREKNEEERKLEQKMKKNKIRRGVKKYMSRIVKNIKNKTKNQLKKSKTIVKIYRKMKHIPDYAVDGNAKLGDYPLYEITSIHARKSLHQESLRINIMVPTLYAENVFGGIATALKFFDSFQDKKIAKRIIVTETPVRKEDIERYPDFKIVSMEEDSDAKYQVVSISNRGGKTLEVSEKDIFIATAWWSAYTIESVIKWQQEAYQKKIKPLIYFIQDYEPYFHAWSSKYCYSESTYHLDIPTIAVFNSKELKDYFNANHYEFLKEFYFDPILNDALKEKLETLKPVKRKKKIIVYGRPNVARNAFEIIVDSLITAFQDRSDIEEWEFISVGEKHQNVQLLKGKQLVSIGKLKLDDYAKLMNESYLGISLMISPHPSYPPLEMSTFGVKTITNCYANKDMSYFNKNIISVKRCNPQTIAKEINRLCDSYSSDGKPDLNADYINASDQFTEIVKEIMKLVK